MNSSMSRKTSCIFFLADHTLLWMVFFTMGYAYAVQAVEHQRGKLSA